MYAPYLYLRFVFNEGVGREVCDRFQNIKNSVLSFVETNSATVIKWNTPEYASQICPGECYFDGIICKCDLRGYFSPSLNIPHPLLNFSLNPKINFQTVGLITRIN